MSNRTPFRIIALALILAVLSVSAIYDAGAQDQPRPPQPKQTQQQQNDPKDKISAQVQGQVQGGQAGEPAVDKEGTIKIDTELVMLDVTVIDQNDKPIFNLKKEDFSVYEDKIKQQVENVIRQELPISLGLVIDTSGSMGSKIQTVSEAAVMLIKQMRYDDEAFVAPFKTEPELAQDFTSDKSELEDAISDLYTRGGTALLDAIIATADYAHEKGKRRRKALVVFSDGLDRNSAFKEKEVIEAIKENEVQVYLVGFINEEMEAKNLSGKAAAKQAKELLMRIAEDSGGRAYFPKDVSEITTVAAQIAKDLRSQYLVSYYPSNDKRDGGFRTIQVAVSNTGGRKMIARARRGYYTRNEKAQLPSASPKKSPGN
jgi:Ca-activated chloride channel family protein